MHLLHFRDVLAVILLAGRASLAAVVSPGSGVHGPVIESNFADPSLYFDAESKTWYSFATINRVNHVQMATSTDFIDWKLSPNDAMPNITRAEWVNGTNDPTQNHVWGLDVHRSPNGTSFMMYFAATSAANPKYHCIGAATSLQKADPYTPEPHPITCNPGPGGAIDASSFTDKDTAAYIMYKLDNGGPAKLLLQQMKNTTSRAGLDPLLNSQPVDLLDSVRANGTSGPDVEAPVLRYHAASQTYFLLYSANFWVTPKYDVEYATSKELRGKYVRAEKPLLRTGDFPELDGPGGASFSEDMTRIVFHNRAKGPIRGGEIRNLWVGYPKVEGGTIGF